MTDLNVSPECKTTTTQDRVFMFTFEGHDGLVRGLVFAEYDYEVGSTVSGYFKQQEHDVLDNGFMYWELTPEQGMLGLKAYSNKQDILVFY